MVIGAGDSASSAGYREYRVYGLTEEGVDEEGVCEEDVDLFLVVAAAAAAAEVAGSDGRSAGCA